LTKGIALERLKLRDTYYHTGWLILSHRRESASAPASKESVVHLTRAYRPASSFFANRIANLHQEAIPPHKIAPETLPRTMPKNHIHAPVTESHAHVLHCFPIIILSFQPLIIGGCNRSNAYWR